MRHFPVVLAGSGRSGQTGRDNTEMRKDAIMETDLAHWRPARPPARETLDGRLVRLEPLDPARHGDQLLAASSVSDAASRFRYLSEEPPVDRESFEPWLRQAAASVDPLFFAVIDKGRGVAVGRQAFMRIEPRHGVIEIGSIYWGPELARRPGATEAFYLAARHVFDTLGYRRFEWKCDNANQPSRRAAERFGFTFEGVFRQHMVVKGRNRDTAWFSIIDREWPLCRAALEAWLQPQNFDADGRQKARLEELRAALVGARALPEGA
jgi:RimJ/RimL family protein N-acetyltransferase